MTGVVASGTMQANLSSLAHLNERYPVPEGWEPSLEQQAEELWQEAARCTNLLTARCGAGDRRPTLVESMSKLMEVRQYLVKLLQSIRAGEYDENYRKAELEMAAMSAYMRELMVLADV